MLRDGEKDCPAGWTKGQVGSINRCYKLIGSLEKSWYNAQAICRSQGGDLAIIKNAEEDTYLANFGNFYNILSQAH